MAKIIPFQTIKQKHTEKEALKLIRISDEIDAVIVKHLKADDIDIRDLAGLLSHRLGTLVRGIEGKETVWEVCEKILKKQADLVS